MKVCQKKTRRYYPSSNFVAGKERQGGTTRPQTLSQVVSFNNKEMLQKSHSTHAFAYSMHISFVHMLYKLRPNTVSPGMIWTWAMAPGHAECHANCFF
jgi:hypothetical protein